MNLFPRKESVILETVRVMNGCALCGTFIFPLKLIDKIIFQRIQFHQQVAVCELPQKAHNTAVLSPSSGTAIPLALHVNPNP